ncbi:MAG: site-specific integrase [Acidobacteria bacterium]|nr:site-specific integrase [Acidobacteriota bacterium]
MAENTSQSETKAGKSKARRPGGKTKRGDGKWLLRIFRGYDADGRRIYYSEIFHGGSREADDRLGELRNRHKAGLPLTFVSKTFKDFFDEWIEERDDGERRECTISQYRQIGRLYLLPAFGKFALTDITDVAIARHYKELRKRKLAQATISLAHVLLTNIFKLATKRGLVLVNPMLKVEGPGRPKPKPVAMTTDESQTFLDAASAHPEGFMFGLAFYLGCRPCEYLGLKWSDVDFKEKLITIQRSLKLRKGSEWYVTPPKTEKSIRSIPMTATLVKGLEDHRRRQLEMRLRAGASWSDHGFIFTDTTGEPLKLPTVRKIYKRICVEAGLPSTWQLKASRHSSASALLKKGVSLKVISERLGHSSIAITADVYSVVEEQLQRQASEALEEAFGIGKLR